MIFRFFSDFLIFRLFADRSAYTSTALIFRVFRIFLFSGYLPAATHTCISPPATARLVSHIVNQLLLAIITAAKLILVLWLRRYSESCRVPLKLILCTVSLGAYWALVGSGCRKWVDDLMRRGILVPGGRVRGRSGRRDGAAGGWRSRERRLRRELALSSRIRAARGTKFFSKMTVFFSTHSIENFASIYGS